jgi:hypothetical protein
MQTKVHSLIESLTNVAVGYIVSLAGQILIFPLFGIDVPIRDNILIGVAFTVLSIARSYYLRRIFNRINPKPKDSITLVFGMEAIKWVIEDEKGGDALRNMIIDSMKQYVK